MFKHVYSNKVRPAKHRSNSLATINLEDLFGPISINSRENSSKYYPNTVPQMRISSMKAFGLSNDSLFDDHIESTLFSSTNLNKNRRRSRESDSKKL